MSEPAVARLEDRGILAVSGSDRVRFLQGLVSNDVTRISPTRGVYAGLLTPQGKYLFDFLMINDGDRILLECEASRLADLAGRLRLYRLRLKVDLADAGDVRRVYAVHGDRVFAILGLDGEAGSVTACLGGLAMVDPRLPALGARLVLPAEADPCSLGLFSQSADAYEAHRIRLGIPDGSRDMVIQKTTLLEAGFDELQGIDWQKGCYVGQELTARMKYRGLVKRRLMPVRIDGPLPPAGTPVSLDGVDAGEMRSAHDGQGIAMIRLNMLTAAAGMPLQAGDAAVRPYRPDWAQF